MKCYNLRMLTVRELGQTSVCQLRLGHKKLWVLSAEVAPSPLSCPKAVRGTGLGLC